MGSCAVSKHFTTADAHVPSHLLLNCNPTTKCSIIRLSNKIFQYTVNTTDLDSIHLNILANNMPSVVQALVEKKNLRI